VLYPLAEMVKTIRSITAMTAHGTRVGGLTQRVPSPGGHDEMAQVVDTFNEMLVDLENAARTQRRFVADASHELRAPLTTIQGNLAFLQRHVDELPADERRVMLADAHSETLRLAQLVEELLLLARADASVDAPSVLAAGDTVDMEGGKVREQRPIELDHTVLQLVRQFRGRLSDEETKVKLEVGHIEPVRVNGDEERIRRVLLILLDNALKYTTLDEHGQAGRVVISLEKIGAEACVRVRDTGIGIDKDDLPHIFERFYRADRARSRQGTGLGLAIAQTVMEQLGGRISVESTPGKGSTFSIWLPLT
jgi:two-component system, OmpR family, sensor kinase